jgi:hypothetical protein
MAEAIIKAKAKLLKKSEGPHPNIRRVIDQ